MGEWFKPTILKIVMRKHASQVQILLSPSFYLISLLMLGGCISPGYHQRERRKAQGLPRYIQHVNPEQEYENFMNHVRPPEPEEELLEK